MGNFGDDANARLWPTRFPGLADHHPGAWLYGVGTTPGGARFARESGVTFAA